IFSSHCIKVIVGMLEYSENCSKFATGREFMFGKKFNQRYNTIPKIRKQKKKNRIYVSKSKIGKKRILHSNKRPPWQWPAFLFVAIFVAVILVIPALIVVPFIQDDSAESVTAETDPVSVELQEGDSPFSVAVLR